MGLVVVSETFVGPVVVLETFVGSGVVSETFVGVFDDCDTLSGEVVWGDPVIVATEWCEFLVVIRGSVVVSTELSCTVLSCTESGRAVVVVDELDTSGTVFVPVEWEAAVAVTA